MMNWLSCDYLFNSHRMMSKIRLNDGTILEEVKTEPFKYQLENLAYIKTRFSVGILLTHDGSNYQIKACSLDYLEDKLTDVA